MFSRSPAVACASSLPAAMLRRTCPQRSTSYVTWKGYCGVVFSLIGGAGLK